MPEMVEAGLRHLAAVHAAQGIGGCALLLARQPLLADRPAAVDTRIAANSIVCRCGGGDRNEGRMVLVARFDSPGKGAAGGTVQVGAEGALRRRGEPWVTLPFVAFQTRGQPGRRADQANVFLEP
jgi:hypothetical protein